MYIPAESIAKREDPIRSLDQIDRYRPKRVRAYASTARRLAKYALEEGMQPIVEAIETNCEVLLEARRKIEETFRCGVYNFYG